MDERPTGDLLTAAGNGDETAWQTIVSRFERVIWAATYGFRLDEAARADVFQLTWLRLLDNLDRIHEPKRLAGWLATTARRECLAVVRHLDRMVVAEVAETAIDLSPDLSLIRSEETEAVLEALAEIDERCRQLLRLLMDDPPADYETISATLDIAIGSIGPTRARCLDKLRKRPAISRINPDRNHSVEKGAATDER